MKSGKASPVFYLSTRWVVSLCLILLPLVSASAFPGTLFFGAFGEYEYSRETSWTPDLGAYGFYSHRVFLSDSDYLSIQSSAAVSDIIHGVYDSQYAEIAYDKLFEHVKLSAETSLTTSIIDSYVKPQWRLGIEEKEKRNKLTPFGGYEGSFYFDALRYEHTFSHTVRAGAAYSPKIERSYRSWAEVGYTDYVWSSRRDITLGLHENISGFLGYLITWDVFINGYYNFSTEPGAQSAYGAVETDFTWSPHRDIHVSLKPKFSAAFQSSERDWTLASIIEASLDYSLTEFTYLYIKPSVEISTQSAPRFVVSGGFDLSLL